MATFSLFADASALRFIPVMNATRETGATFSGKAEASGNLKFGIFLPVIQWLTQVDKGDVLSKMPVPEDSELRQYFEQIELAPLRMTFCHGTVIKQLTRTI
jgi:hypothetical protein